MRPGLVVKLLPNPEMEGKTVTMGMMTSFSEGEQYYEIWLEVVL